MYGLAATLSGMRKKLIGLTGIALVLSGCSAAPAAEPTPAIAPNAAACINFQNTLVDGIDYMSSEVGGWEKLRDNVDEVALQAEGDVKVRIQGMVDDWPDAFDVLVMNELDGVNEMIASVERACDAAGQNIDGSQFTLSD